MSPIRGSYQFEIDDGGRVLGNAANRDRLARLFRDGGVIGGEWGPGRSGDFDHGSWHILCHLAAGAGVLDAPAGRMWCGLTYDRTADRYDASIVFRDGAQVGSEILGTPAASSRLNGARTIAFIEGSSQGHIAARGVNDAPTAFNRWPRQSFDRDISSASDGGTVWEHWCTTRDIRPTSAIGRSVLNSYFALVVLLGGKFIAAIARGRREHEHPRHLVAMVRAGLLSEGEATWDTTPVGIPQPQQLQLYEARVADNLAAAESLAGSPVAPVYHMFRRRLDRWSSASAVARDLRTYP